MLSQMLNSGNSPEVALGELESLACLAEINKNGNQMEVWMNDEISWRADGSKQTEKDFGP